MRYRHHFLIAFVLLLNCLPNRIEIDPISYGDYYIDNKSSYTLFITANEVGTETHVDLIDSAIIIGTKTKIYTFIEGSGGHVLPSNAFSVFNVYIEQNDIKILKYSQVNNEDWHYESFSADSHAIYTFVITDSLLAI